MESSRFEGLHVREDIPVAESKHQECGRGFDNRDPTLSASAAAIYGTALRLVTKGLGEPEMKCE